MAHPFDMSLVQRGARLRRSPYFDATLRDGCRGYTVYNHMFLPIKYADFESEHQRLLEDVTVWDVSVERQVEITGPDAFALTNMLTPRDLTKCAVGQGKYVIITAADGGIINDPVLLRLGENHFWLALADSDVLLWAKGVAHGLGLDVEIGEPDVSPLQIQGPKSKALMNDLIGDQVDLDNMPFYGLAEAKVGGRSCVISQSGFSGEAGYEIYLRNATKYAEDMWNAVLDAGKKHNLMVIAPAHHRRIQAGILSWGQDMDQEHNPFQCNLGYQVSLSGKGEWNKTADYVGKETLEKMKSQIKNGEKPYKLQLVGIELGGKPIEEYAPDFWLISNGDGGKPVGFITSPWYHPEKGKNIAMGYVPFEGTLNANGFPKGEIGKKYKVHLPAQYSDVPDKPVDAVIVEIPFTESFNANTREVVKG